MGIQFRGFDGEPSDADMAKSSPSISRILMEGLFGKYSYDLRKSSPSDDSIPLLILAGDNGTGKTTLLKLIYHALSYEDNRGHRTELVRTQFRRLRLEFTDGTIYDVERDIASTGGKLVLSVTRKETGTVAASILVDEKLTVNRSSLLDSANYDSVLKSLMGMYTYLHFLSDDRKHQGSLRAKHLAAKPEAKTTRTIKEMRASQPDAETENQDSLLTAMGRVTSWAAFQARQGATKGLVNADAAYSKVLSDIARSLEIQPPNPLQEVQRLAVELTELQLKSAEYSKLGLAPNLQPADDILRSIAGTTAGTAPVFYTVFKPYVDGVKARLRALDQVHSVVNRFLVTVNEFYRNKTVQFHLDHGITIWSDKERIDPLWLSSGERQLLLLFCNTILARRGASLFLIDEPELSLNVKWQRLLVQSLIDNAAGASVQFILATHSTELIAQHRSSVARLSTAPTGRPPEPHEELWDEQAEQ